MKLLFSLTIFFVTLAFSYKDIDNTELEQLVSNEGAIIIDVRLEDEWKDTGIIQNSIPLTYFDKSFKPMMNEFLNGANKATHGDKLKPIVVVCRTGQRSVIASQALDKTGYKNVYNLKYGIYGWRSDNKKLVKYAK